MKHILALGTVILSGALFSVACTASDSDNDPDTTPNTGGAGGASNNGGTSSGTNTVNTATGSGGTGGSTTGSGGTYSSGGSAGSAAGSAGEGGWAGDDSTTGQQTTGSGGMGGTPFECLGDDPVADLPDCADLEYAEVECNEFDPPEPFGVTHCKQFAAHATPEAFDAMFECLDDIDEDDACGAAHDDAVRLCRDGNLEDDDDSNDGVVPLTCESTLARDKCANLGCPEVDTEVDGECDVYLSTFTSEGVDHVIACTNDHTGDEEGGEWGAGPDTEGCGEVFLGCVVGLLQPTH
ncbi:MAG TPA: hypothetical protein VFU02_05530 [Polyangiaceae bacterium]|nr:hypothetical protein [Polyangiaceae bacterium]